MWVWESYLLCFLRLSNSLGVRFKLLGLAFGTWLPRGIPTCLCSPSFSYTSLSLRSPLGVQWVTSSVGREAMRWTPDSGPLFPYLPSWYTLGAAWGTSPMKTLPIFTQAFVFPSPCCPTCWNLTFPENRDKSTILCLCPQFLHPGEKHSQPQVSVFLPRAT